MNAIYGRLVVTYDVFADVLTMSDVWGRSRRNISFCTNKIVEN